MSQAATFGTRLAFVVVPIEGKVKRAVTTFNKSKGLQTKDVEEPFGYLVYFPRGHAIRVKSAAMLKHYGLDGKPNIINLQGLNDPNSPMGRLMSAQDDAARKGAMDDLQAMVIQLATAKTGTVLIPDGDIVQRSAA